MTTILITGPENVVGANLIAGLSISHHVITPHARENAAALVAEHRPDVIIDCGPAGESSWWTDRPRISAADVSGLQALLDAADETLAQLIYISSDSVYRGPWMFHDEESGGRGQTPQSERIREAEAIVLNHPAGLVLRTNVLGWTPNQVGVLDNLVRDLDAGRPVNFGHFATPIGAVAFVRVLERAIGASLTGLFNIGGAERISAHGLARELADALELPTPAATETAVDCETSMRSARIRSKLFGVELPGVLELITELTETQHRFRENDQRLPAAA